MLSDLETEVLELAARAGLNAPYGARCFLTERIPAVTASVTAGLNAPYGARCFLTKGMRVIAQGRLVS